MKKKEILYLLKSDESRKLFKEADRITKSYFGNKIIIRGIAEFSNNCLNNCLYCGLRRDNKNLNRYRMKPRIILEISSKIVKAGIETVVLQSGDDLSYTQSIICKIIKDIKKEHKDTAITLSLGERPLADYKAFFESGADRYLLKHETINEKLYTLLHPGQSFKKRIKILESLRDIGYQVGAGSIIGLPHQSLEDLAEELLFLQDFQPDMIGIGPFLPQKNTPLAKFKAPELNLILRVLALTRILTKDAHIPATTALASLDKNKGQVLALGAGCNVMMADFTPQAFSRDYKIYDNRVKVNLKRIRETVKKAKKEISFEKGDSLK